MSHEILVSSDDIRRCLAAAEERVARNFEERDKLDAELRDVKLKLELMEGWKKRVTYADRKRLLLSQRLLRRTVS